MIKCLVIVSLFISLSARTQILLTAINDSINDVRACYFDLQKGEVLDISSNNTYMPLWCDDEIIYNFGNHIWKMNHEFKEERILFEGLKPVYNSELKILACLSRRGVIIGDLNGKLLKQLELDVWDKASITFSKNGQFFSYYDKIKETCMLFDWKKEEVKKFGGNIIHPSWSPDGKRILINSGKMDELFKVGIVDTSWNETDPVYYISSPDENAILPMWSPKQNYIAYFVLDDNNINEHSDLHSGKIVFYRLSDRKKIVVSENAGYTEGSYYQFSFDKEEEYFYYTSINKYGKGAISSIKLKNKYENKVILSSQTTDYRLPNAK